MAVATAAKQITAILTRKKPRDRYIIASNRLISKISTLEPQSYVDKVVARMFDMDYH